MAPLMCLGWASAAALPSKSHVGPCFILYKKPDVLRSVYLAVG